MIRLVDKGVCQRCGMHVTRAFRRTYGDAENVAHRCVNCDVRGRLKAGSAAGKDLDAADPLDEPWRFDEPVTEKPAPVQRIATPVATDGGDA